ncbi:hypothetical protein [Cognatiyoonia sp. IB215182]|uniref:hypothetical protein n=1 Tax=Cognatiyoonia sp. IB215182 TaxID=3097353 RepID=UPI002A101763|nr:hypothetical protein [Cognatiyoonia sp. IB215182]MDX8352358.1 hypothetical protein [Cognatiyoonia sp. IB215182]
MKWISILTVAMSGLAATAYGQSLESQLATARQAAEPYMNIDTARRDGWRPFGGDEPLMGQHWHQRGGVDYASGAPIDPRRPSNLLYTDLGGQMQLVALSYNVRIAPGEPVPEGFVGSSDEWHVHDVAAFIAAAGADRPLLRGLAQGWLDREIAQRDGKTRLAMVHLWLIPNPDGVFASHNRTLAYLDLGLPAAWANGAPMASARGLALAGPNGCDEALEGRLWVANVDRSTARRLMQGCEQMADFVQEGLPGDMATTNARAASAWMSFDRFLQDTLTADQKRRIAAIAEHGMDHGAAEHH